MYPQWSLSVWVYRRDEEVEEVVEVKYNTSIPLQFGVIIYGKGEGRDKYIELVWSGAKAFELPRTFEEGSLAGAKEMVVEGGIEGRMDIAGKKGRLVSRGLWKFNITAYPDKMLEGQFTKVCVDTFCADWSATEDGAEKYLMVGSGLYYNKEAEKWLTNTVQLDEECENEMCYDVMGGGKQCEWCKRRRTAELELACGLCNHADGEILHARVSYMIDDEWVYTGCMSELMCYQKGGVLENEKRGVLASGDFEKNTLHGRCKMVIYTDKTIRVLVGEFREGKPHGQIVETSGQSFTNTDEIASKLVNESVKEYSDGVKDTYEGLYDKGSRMGKGRLASEYENCTRVVEGCFTTDGIRGHGKCTWTYKKEARQRVFEGEFLRGIEETKGKEVTTVTTGDGSTRTWVREGRFKNDAQCGQGEVLFPDGTRYTGSFKDGLRHGNGVEVPGNPKRPNITGKWVKDLKQGQFTVRTNKSHYLATYKDGELDGSFAIHEDKRKRLCRYKMGTHIRTIVESPGVVKTGTGTFMGLQRVVYEGKERTITTMRRVGTNDHGDATLGVHKYDGSGWAVDTRDIVEKRHIVALQSCWRGHAERAALEARLCKMRAAALIARRLRVDTDEQTSDTEASSPLSGRNRKKKKRRNRKKSPPENDGPAAWSDQCGDPETQVGGAMKIGRYALRGKPQLVKDFAEVTCNLHGCTEGTMVDKMRAAVFAAEGRGETGKWLGFITGSGSHSGSGRGKKKNARPVLRAEAEHLVTHSWGREAVTFSDGVCVLVTGKLCDHLRVVAANRLA